jgi:hypothetical protein
MRHFAPLGAASAACAAFAFATPAHAAIIDTFSVGSGASMSTIQIDFESGNGYIINYSWDGPATGWSALLAIDAALTDMAIQYQTFSFGVFLTGISIGPDHNYGTGDLWPIENYWHYWTAQPTDAPGSWTSSMVGAADRVLVDGARDAWVFGSPALPQAVPAPGALVMLAVAGTLAGRRRRAHAR